MRHSHLFFLMIALLVTSRTSELRAETKAGYNPLQISTKMEVETKDLTVKDEKRSREIPILVYLPKSSSPAPVILFSHGLGGARHTCAYLGKHWAKRGYVAVFLQHPGSDESVWKDVPLLKRMAAMRKAASLQNFQLRVKDVPAVLDQLEKWNQAKDHALAHRMDLSKVGMAGHSFGARTTQSVSGQTAFGGRIYFTDSRIKAAMPLSPSAPQRGDVKQAFGKVKIPWLLMTGTKDVAIIGNAALKDRLAVYPALPAGNKYELVLYNAEHSAFTERRLPGDKEKRNPNHHRAILAVSTAFWDATLREDKQAKEWLDGEGPKSVLEEKDRWQKK